MAVLIKVKDVRLAPHVRGVRRDVHGHVAHDAHAALVSVGAELVPLLLELKLQLARRLDAQRQLGVIRKPRRIAAILLWPGLPRGTVELVLQRAERGIGREPVVVVVTELRKAAIAKERVIGENLLGVAFEKGDVACVCSQPRVGRTVLVRGVHGEHLPVALAATGEPVHKALGRRTQRARPAVVGHRGHVAQHAHATLQRLLEPLVPVEVQHRRAQRPQEDLRLALRYLGVAAGDNIRDLHPALDGHPHGMRVFQAGVDQHAHAVALGSAPAPEPKHVIAHRKRVEPAVHQHVERLAHGNGVAVDVKAVLVAAAPGVGRTVVRVAEALHAALVPVVDAGNARQGHLQQRDCPQAALGQVTLAGVKAIRRTLGLGERVGVGRATQCREQPLAIVAAQEVELAVERLARVVLAQLLQAPRELLRANLVAHEGEKSLAQRVVHGAVKLRALEVLAQRAVGGLVAGVFPHLANEKAVGLLGENRMLDVRDEAVGQLVCNVQAPAACAIAQPPAHHALATANELVVGGVVLVDGGKVVHAPPAVVGPVIVERVPRAID